MLATDRRIPQLDKLAGGLATLGIEVHWAYRLGQARVTLERGLVDALLLRALPGIYLGSLLEWARTHDPAIPLVGLTDPQDAATRVLAFQLGADDCVDIDIDAGELAARLGSIQSRRAGQGRLRLRRPSQITVGPYRFEPAEACLQSADRRVVLQPSESAVLAALVSRPGAPITRAELARECQASSRRPSDRAIDVVVSRLRHKLGDDPAEPRYIHTRRNQGYLFEDKTRTPKPHGDAK